MQWNQTLRTGVKEISSVLSITEQGNMGVEKTAKRGALLTALLTPCYPCNQIKKSYDSCGVRRGTYRVFVRKLQGKRPRGRRRCRWVNYIKMDLQDVGWNHAKEWTDWKQGLIVGSCICVMNIRNPYNAGNTLTSSVFVNFRRSLCSLESVS